MRTVLAIFMFIVSSGMPAWAQTPSPQDLEKIQSEQLKAKRAATQLERKKRKLSQDIETLQSTLLKKSRDARRVENQRDRAQKKIQDLQHEKKDVEKRLADNQSALSDILAALQRIESHPPPLILMNNVSVQNAARSALIAADLSKTLKVKSNALALELETLTRIQSDIEKEMANLKQAKKQTNVRINDIRNLLSQKSALSAQVDKNREKRLREAERLAKQAKSLRELIARFEDQVEDITPRLKPKPGVRNNPAPRVKPKPQKRAKPIVLPKGISRFSDARGALPLPAQGQLLTRFGAKLKTGGISKGMRIQTQPGAHIIAPFYGRVEFAGPFNDDHVVILNVSDGYFIVLTGLAETFTQAGNMVKAGEPLGLMPENRSILFLEFRKNRKSINPTPWVGHAFAG